MATRTSPGTTPARGRSRAGCSTARDTSRASSRSTGPAGPAARTSGNRRATSDSRRFSTSDLRDSRPALSRRAMAQLGRKVGALVSRQDGDRRLREARLALAAALDASHRARVERVAAEGLERRVHLPALPAFGVLGPQGLQAGLDLRPLL